MVPRGNDHMSGSCRVICCVIKKVLDPLVSGGGNSICSRGTAYRQANGDHVLETVGRRLVRFLDSKESGGTRSRVVVLDCWPTGSLILHQVHDS